MEKRYIAAFDQGTTSSRTIIFDKRGRVVSKAHVEFPQIYPKAGGWSTTARIFFLRS